MQAGKIAGASAKEAASIIAGSAKSGFDKTKAIMQEKGERMTAHDPLQKEMATQKKEEKIHHAELNKEEAREHNAAARQAASVGGTGTYTHSTTGDNGHITGLHPMSAVPGHGTGEPMGGQLTEGVMGSQLILMGTGTGRTAAQNPYAGGGGTNTGHGTDGTYT